ncbi:ricin-type beta-trefoil lectin domain protein [Jiangella alba]|uniref:ricin-type beta-trefoil lectin domain protein n=1 Tax=Jiangella alba TaxID=561176 RepID=UPI0033945153
MSPPSRTRRPSRRRPTIRPGTPGPFRIRNPTTGICLDSNERHIYYGKCNSTDAGQKWGWWNGGWLISLQTGKCVSPWGGDWPEPYLSLQGCWSDLLSQRWIHQNQAIKNVLHGTASMRGPKAPSCSRRSARRRPSRRGR